MSSINVDSKYYVLEPDDHGKIQGRTADEKEVNDIKKEKRDRIITALALRVLVLLFLSFCIAGVIALSTGSPGLGLFLIFGSGFGLLAKKLINTNVVYLQMKSSFWKWYDEKKAKETKEKLSDLIKKNPIDTIQKLISRLACLDMLEYFQQINSNVNTAIKAKLDEFRNHVEERDEIMKEIQSLIG